jgi:hypothetical protein
VFDTVQVYIYIIGLFQSRLGTADYASVTSSLRYHDSLDTCTVLHMTAAKFKPLIFSVSGFTLSNVANISFLSLYTRTIMSAACQLQLVRGKADGGATWWLPCTVTAKYNSTLLGKLSSPSRTAQAQSVHILPTRVHHSELCSYCPNEIATGCTLGE